MKRRAALVLLGGAAQLVGAATLLLGLWCAPDGGFAYRLTQALLAAAFLAGFYFCARRAARARGDGACFFALPTLSLLLGIFARGVHESPVTSVLVSGLAVPFHTLLPTLQFAFDRALLLPKALPVLACMLAFRLGSRADRTPDARRARRGAALACAIFIALALVLPDGFAHSADGERSTADAGDIVCVMRIYSDPPVTSLGPLAGGFGHTFLTFHNVSSTDLMIGRHMLAPDKMVSIGKFARLDGCAGTFYNAETDRAARLGWYTGARSLGMALTAKQLEAVNAQLCAHENGYLWVGSNCATLSALAWNAALPAGDSRRITHFSTPAQVYQDITAAGSYLDGNGLLQADYALCYFNGATKVLCTDYA